MATKKTSKKKGAREFAVDRSAKIAAMVKDIQGSKAKSDSFFADPGAVAKGYGVTLAAEEKYAIKFASGLALASVIGKIKRPGVAFFDSNCSCPGPGPSSW